MVSSCSERQPRSVQASDEAGPRDRPSSEARHSGRDAAQHSEASRPPVRSPVRQYIALIHKNPDSDYGVSFPDLLGCITAGRDLDEARAMAEEALSLHLEGMAEDGETAPEPSTLETVMTDRENRDAVAILVQVKSPAPKVVRLNITMAETVLAEVDAFAESKGMNRSGFLAYAATQVMEDAAKHIAKHANIVAWDHGHPVSEQERQQRHDAVRSVGQRMAVLANSARNRQVDYTEFEILFRELLTLGSALPNQMVHDVAEAFVAAEKKRASRAKTTSLTRTQN